jgi:hypothetical protein
MGAGMSIYSKRALERMRARWRKYEARVMEPQLDDIVRYCKGLHSCEARLEGSVGCAVHKLRYF